MMHIMDYVFIFDQKFQIIHWMQTLLAKISVRSPLFSITVYMRDAF